MNTTDFMKNVRRRAYEVGVESVVSNLRRPPGRAPYPLVVKLSQWFASLSEPDKEMVKCVVRDSVHTGVFGMLCIIDGARAITSEPNSGNLELYYVRNSERILLNDPWQPDLHDLLGGWIEE